MGSGDNVFTVVAKNIDVLAMFPIWSYAKLVGVCWLVLPYFNGAAYVYGHFIRPFYRNPQVKLWYIPRQKDIFSKPDDILTAAEKYVEENGPEAFERIIARADREARSRRSSYTIFHNDYEY
ncbi:hva22-like protein a [Phtheirospermum japonicum]|uniref:HVA22-like protein n=1 Tax=Phtheirospermum japonicum TaxID=374723 RepID=A0A830BQU6_9LAMI|nr:hva22-like protein a [Phtheirospermum japonicum]